MFGHLGKMMKLAGELKTKLPELQERLANSRYTAEAGGGAVTATVTGKLELADVKIQLDLVTEEGVPDVAMLEEWVKAAVSAAQQKAMAAAKEAMLELTGGVDLPGMGAMLP